jgi:hypothetical protein
LEGMVHSLYSHNESDCFFCRRDIKPNVEPFKWIYNIPVLRHVNKKLATSPLFDQKI